MRDLRTSGAGSFEADNAPGYLAFRHCCGFRVESADGHVGFVEDVLFGSDPERPAALAIRSPRFDHQVNVVAVEAVEAVFANERRVRLRPPGGGETRTTVSGTL